MIERYERTLGADQSKHSGICSADAWQPADVSHGYAYTAGDPAALPAVPSTGDYYYLSGRALVDQILRSEATKDGGRGQIRPRKPGPSDEVLASLRARMAAAGVSLRAASIAMGYKGADQSSTRLRGERKWAPGDMEKLIAHLEKVEAGR